jgi:hypothetical protein
MVESLLLSWNHGADARAFTGARPDLESTVRQPCSLGHADESKAAAASGVIGDEALALIPHLQLDPIRRHGDVHATLGDASVLADVSQRFLRDPIHE